MLIVALNMLVIKLNGFNLLNYEYSLVLKAKPNSGIIPRSEEFNADSHFLCCVYEEFSGLIHSCILERDMPFGDPLKHLLLVIPSE